MVVADPGFFGQGGGNSKGRCPPIICPNVAENCMKMKKIRPRWWEKGARPKLYYVDPSLLPSTSPRWGGGGGNPKGDTSTYSFSHFSENCMKLKKKPWTQSLLCDPPMVWNHFCNCLRLLVQRYCICSSLRLVWINLYIWSATWHPWRVWSKYGSRYVSSTSPGNSFFYLTTKNEQIT